MQAYVLRCLVLSLAWCLTSSLGCSDIRAERPLGRPLEPAEVDVVAEKLEGHWLLEEIHSGTASIRHLGNGRFLCGSLVWDDNRFVAIQAESVVTRDGGRLIFNIRQPETGPDGKPAESDGRPWIFLMLRLEAPETMSLVGPNEETFREAVRSAALKGELFKSPGTDIVRGLLGAAAKPSLEPTTAPTTVPATAEQLLVRLTADAKALEAFMKGKSDEALFSADRTTTLRRVK